MHTSRRDFLIGTLAAGLMLSEESLRAAPKTRAVTMLREALELGRRLRRGEISQLDWQDRIGPILRSATVEEIRDAIGLELLRDKTPRVRLGAAVKPLPLSAKLNLDEGAAMRVFFFGAGRTDPPHCHFNQVTSHLVLAGKFRVRHFERLREEGGGFVLRPSHDREIGIGDSTSISELRDNAHWHAAITDGVLLDVEQSRLDPSRPPRHRQMLDVSVAPRADGSILAPCLDRETALRKFG